MLVNLQHAGGPLYRRIYHGLKTAIGDGRLQPGARLPSSRALADDLGVARNTVVLAYEQLVAEGYVVSRDRAAPAVVGAAGATPPAAEAPRPAATPRLSAYGRHLVADPAMPYATTYAHRPELRWDFRYGRPAVHEFPRETW